MTVSWAMLRRALTECQSDGIDFPLHSGSKDEILAILWELRRAVVVI